MSESNSYLIRKLAIISSDGQFQNCGLSYVMGKRVQMPGDTEGVYLSDLEISAFDRERPNTAFIDSLTLKEMPEGIWKLV